MCLAEREQEREFYSSSEWFKGVPQRFLGRDALVGRLSEVGFRSSAVLVLVLRPVPCPGLAVALSVAVSHPARIVWFRLHLGSQIQKRFIKQQLPAIIDTIRRNVHTLKTKVNKYGVVPNTTREYVSGVDRPSACCSIDPCDS